MSTVSRAAEAAAALDGTRVLVTGGLGFIGSNLVRVLAGAGAHVCVIDVGEPGEGGHFADLGDASSRVDVRVGDARDRAVLDDATGGCDVVFSLAAQTGHMSSMSDPVRDLDQNCGTALSVLEAVREQSPGARVVFTSTRQVYGRPQRLPVRETDPVAPVDVNGIHKLAAEQYHGLYHRIYGLDTCVLRLTNVYGPRMRICDARQSFIGHWVGLALAGEVIPVYRPGTQRRDLLHVDDAVAALCVAAVEPEVSGEVLNLAGSEPASLLQVAHVLATLSRRSEVVLVDFPADRRSIDIGDVLTDADKARRLLGWQPEVSLVDGLARTMAYFERHSVPVTSGA